MSQLRHGPSVSKIRSHSPLRIARVGLASRLLDGVLGARGDRVSNRELSRRYWGHEGNERMVRFFREGTFEVSWAFVLALPYDLADEALSAAREALRSGTPPSGVSVERVPGLAMIDLGYLAETVERYRLDDGVIDDDEKRRIAPLVRALGAKLLRWADELEMRRTGTNG